MASNSSPSITVDHLGLVYHTDGTSSNQTNTGSNDIVVFKLDPNNGQCLWVVQQPTFNTSDGDLLRSILRINCILLIIPQAIKI
jgi:hypothetical protein